MINRREFIRSVGALAVGATFLPDAEAAKGITQEFLNNFVKALDFAPPDGEYYAFIHPSQYRDLMDMVARDNWRLAYQQWRESKPFPYDPRKILAAFPENQWADSVRVGRYEGVKIITSLP